MVDNDKANIINCTEKKWVRTIKLWSGPMTTDMKYGLGAPNKGGLYLVDLVTGNNLATFIQPGQEGVFTRLTGLNEWIYSGGKCLENIPLQDSLRARTTCGITTAGGAPSGCSGATTPP